MSAEDQKPPPKPRLAPKLGLGGMVQFVMGLRLRARMWNGEDAGEAWTLLRPEDLERLEDVADTLEWFRLQREIERKKGGRR